MKKFCSYAAPICGILTILITDAIMNDIQPKPLDSATWSLLIIYNIFVCLALWSLGSVMLGDPGYIPLKYSYNLSEMSGLCAALYRGATLYVDAKVEVPPGSDFKLFKDMR